MRTQALEPEMPKSYCMGDEIREGIFAHAAVAFVQRDLVTLLGLVRDDVVLTLAGSSPIAGPHHGGRAVARVVMQLRRYVSCTAEPIRFSHEEDRMTAHRDVVIVGQMHRVGMTLHLSLSFDRSGKIRALMIEPSDPGLFDHVVSVELAESDPAPLRIPDLIRDPRSVAPSDVERKAVTRARRHT
jgi:ketosteroid isomerase-like protein